GVQPVSGRCPEELADLDLRPRFPFAWRVVRRRDELDHVADELAFVHGHLECCLKPAEREPYRSWAEAGTGLAATSPAFGEHPVHQVLDVGLADGLERSLAEALPDRTESVPVRDLGGLAAAARRALEVLIQVLAHCLLRRLDIGALVGLVTDPGQLVAGLVVLVEGAGELLALAVVVQADVHDEPVSDRPVLQGDFADWFFHLWLSPSCWKPTPCLCIDFRCTLVCVAMHRKSRQAGDELFDVLGRRWALRLLWEIGDAGLTYRELASRLPDMSTSVLTQRLRELRSAGLVDHARGYRLTPTGQELRTQLGALREWAERVGFAPADLAFMPLVVRRVRCREF